MASRQLALFVDPTSQPTRTSVDVKHRVRAEAVHVKESTFLGGLTARVHRWFRLTPSFGPEIVQRALAEMDTRPNSVVHPFAGAGTTLIEAKYEGHRAVGFEINPVLHFVCWKRRLVGRSTMTCSKAIWLKSRRLSLNCLNSSRILFD